MISGATLSRSGEPGLDYSRIFFFGEHPDKLEGEPAGTDRG